MSLTAGTRLGAYEVIGLIGLGGMGEVYRARDTKLDRNVALKVLAVTTHGRRLMRTLLAFALLLLSTVVTPAALAQDVEGQISGVGETQEAAKAQAVASSFEALQAVLKVGQRVKVRDGAGRSTRGNVVSISSNQLVIHSGPRALGPDMYSWSLQRWAFTEDVVRRIDIVDSFLEGALIGAGVAFGVGLLARAESSSLMGASVSIAVPIGIVVGAVIDWSITQPIYGR